MRDEQGMPLPVEIQSREAMLKATPALGEIGKWICLNVVPEVTWPIRAQSLRFDDYQVWIIPITLEDHPGVALKCPKDMSQDDAEGLLYRLLSVISWREDRGISVAYRTGGSLPRMMGLNTKRGFSICESFDFTEVVYPSDERGRLALALMREGRSLNHFGYAFLSFWRVIELAYPDSKNRVAWMKTTLPTLRGQGVPEALATITGDGIDVARHLFESGRCAIAHAAAQPIINPDDPRDARRLMGELPLVRELAIRAVEEHFGIKTSTTIFREHLYELRGWKEAIGSDVIARIYGDNATLEGETVNLPTINVRLQECRSYGPLEGMLPVEIAVHERAALVTYQSIDGLVGLRFTLDFRAERLVFEVFSSLLVRDDGSIAAADHKRELERFVRDYLLNGVLQMWMQRPAS